MPPFTSNVAKKPSAAGAIALADHNSPNSSGSDLPVFRSTSMLEPTFRVATLTASEADKGNPLRNRQQDTMDWSLVTEARQSSSLRSSTTTTLHSSTGTHGSSSSSLAATTMRPVPWQSSSSTTAAATSGIKLYDREPQIQLLRESFFRRWNHKPEKKSCDINSTETDVPSNCKPSLEAEEATSATTSSASPEEDPSSSSSVMPNFPELILISGSSGTGKTVLARQVMNQLVLERSSSMTTTKATSIAADNDTNKSSPGGYCVWGKFDQLNQLQDAFSIPEPYSAFVAALTELAHLWQLEGTAKLWDLHQKVEAQTESWTVLRALVPALDCVFAPPQPPRDGTSSEISNDKTKEDKKNNNRAVHEAQQDRLQQTLKTFLLTLFSPEEPLNLMLDDLQWSDPASLELLEALVCDPSLQQLLVVVGICRSNEVPWHHDFACTLRHLEDEKRTKITNVMVSGLSLDATAELVADLLHQPLEFCQGVALMIHEKTEGNVFFLLQILKALYEEGVLVAEEEKNSSSSNDDNDNDPLASKTYQWLWHDDIWNEQYKDKEFAAVDLVLRRMKRLPQHCQDLLLTAACLGAECDAELLLVVLHTMRHGMFDGTTASRVDAMDRQALEVVLEERILQEQTHYRDGRIAFAHDRMQQAAYALVPEQHGHAAMHLAIGRAMLQIRNVMADAAANSRNRSIVSSNAAGVAPAAKLLEAAISPDGRTENEEQAQPAFQLEDHIFLLVNQLIRGSPLVEREEDKTGLAILCLEAGRKATQSSDFRMAVQYFTLGTTFLPARPWRDEYHLSLELYCSLGEAQCCVTEFEAMDETLQLIFNNARGEQDKHRANITWIYSHAARLELNKALDLGINVLKTYGETFPAKPLIIYVIMDLLKTQRKLKKMSDRDILNLPNMSIMEHENKVSAVQLMHQMIAYSFLARPAFFPFLSLRSTNLSLKYGLTATASGVFVYLAMLLLAVDDIDLSLRMGKLSLRIMEERFPETRNEWLPQVYSLYYGVVANYQQPIRSCMGKLVDVYEVGRRSGDCESVAMGVQLLCENKFHGGFALKEVQEELDKYLDIMAIYKQGPYYASSKLLSGLVKTLIGNPDSTSNADNTQLINSPLYQCEVNFNTLSCEGFLLRLILFYHLGDFEMAMQMAKKSRVAEEELKPVFSYTVQFFYDAMTSLAMAWDSKKRQRIAHAKKILKKLERLEVYCPHNFSHQILLIKAELSLLSCKPGKKKDLEKTIQLYEQAVKCATAEGFLHVRAIALLRAGLALRWMDNAETNQTRADDYLKRAKEAYKDWGAHTIVISLEERYSI